MKRILFVCTGNLYRSPLAEAFFLQRFQNDTVQDGWEVSSAGTWTKPGQPASADLLAAAEKFGLDLRDHKACMVDAELLAAQDLIVVMEAGHKEALSVEFPSVRGRIVLFMELAAGEAVDVPDPMKTGQPIDELAAELLRLMDTAYGKIIQRVQSAD